MARRSVAMILPARKLSSPRPSPPNRLKPQRLKMVRTVQTVQTVHDSTDSTDISEDGRAGAGMPHKRERSLPAFLSDFCAESAWDFSRPPPTSPIQPRPLWQRRPIPVPFPLFSAGVGGMWHLGVAGRDQFVRAQHPMCKAAEKSMAEA